MAEIPGSVKITGFISPTDSADTYATHDEVYGCGGYRSVVAYGDLEKIPSSRLKAGMLP